VGGQSGPSTQTAEYVGTEKAADVIQRHAAWASLISTILVAVFASGCSTSDQRRSHSAQFDAAGDLVARLVCQRTYRVARVDQTARPRFPIRTFPRRRYLVDKAGKPFLMQGDSPWSLIAELTQKEVNEYLADRKRRGFNTLLVNLLEHRFASKAPANAYGDAPFTQAGDFSTPNEAYFRHADWVLRRASSMGFLVLLAPAYIGFRDSPDGWWREMVASGPEKLRDYGRYVGRRYSRFPNIMWVEGGDDNPPMEGIVDALAAGIAETDPKALQTGHTAPESAPLETWDRRTWLDVNNVYTYKDVYLHSIKEYRRSDLPFFLMESAYEGEHSVSTRRLRIQAWHALLAGATGQLFGNNPIWHFSGPGLYAGLATPPWQQALDTPGARSMTVVGKVFGALPWWRLIPDEVGTRLIVKGRGEGDERAAAAVSCDRRWGLIYLATQRRITVDLAAFKGSTVTFTWIDPSTGKSTPGSPKSAKTTHDVSLAPPGKNATGDVDWLLRLVSR
jgi:hypothetical protein